MPRSSTAPHGTREDERRELLGRYAQYRRPQDLERLVVSYRPLARALAGRYQAAGSREDLEQVAFEGLIKAIRRFEPDRGFAFTSFAVPTIMGELRRHRRNTAWLVHVPRPVQERVQDVRSATERWSATHGRTPTARELADSLARDEEEVLEALCAASSLNVVPLDDPPQADEEAGSTATDQLGVIDPGYDQVECLVTIEDALPALSPAQRTVIRLRFAEDLTQRQIAVRLGISRSEVARVLGSAVETLRSVALPDGAA
jgi:RNA polymerase sigma-B factor